LLVFSNTSDNARYEHQTITTEFFFIGQTQISQLSEQLYVKLLVVVEVKMETGFFWA
jgi:hypothetical protein